VRCAELCGLWHGAMYDYRRGLDRDRTSWPGRGAEVKLASVTKMLPPYALTYDPTNVPSST
jgi:cytochrome c oxidase subunit 2